MSPGEFDDGISRARRDSDPRIARLEADNAHLRGTLETALKGSEGAISAIAADNAQLRAERDRLHAAFQSFLDAPLAQMSYRGGLVSINSNGMRTVIDDCDKFRALCKQLRDALDEHGTFLIEMAEDRPLADAAIKAYDDAMAAEGKEQKCNDN